VLVAEERIADALIAELGRNGAHLCSPEESQLVRETVFPGGRLDTQLVGRDAATIASRAGIRTPPRVRVLVTPFELAVPEEPLAHEKMLPVLGLVRVPDARRGIDAARALLRIGGAGHSAVIHSTDPRTIMAYGAAVDVLRVVVNVGGSTGSAGIGTNLPLTMTIGTGFFGRSSLGQNLGPGDLVNWTRVAYASDPSVPFGDFEGLDPWAAAPERVPAPVTPEAPPEDGALRDEIRRLLLEELQELIRR
jgi:acyl-CoA reductase-like NAD-dependent aldehyde dehydrogenase